METLRPNGQRAKIAVIMIWIVLATEIFSVLSGYMQYDLLQGVANGTEISMEKAEANDSREQIVSVLYLVAFVVSAVTFIQWFRRAYYNLHQKVNGLSYTEGWAAGSWFVPILCLFRPYQIMREMYTETDSFLTSQGISSNQKLNMNLLRWWWALWILNNIIGQISFRISLHAEGIDELINATLVGMIANVIMIPLAVLAVRVVQQYADAESYLDSDSRQTDPYLSLVNPEDV